MRGWNRGLGLLVLLAGLSCKDDPKPLSVRMFWTDGCITELPMFDACASGNHAVIGSQGSVAADVSCGVRAVGGGQYRIRIRAAVFQTGQSTFDESSEGLGATGTAAVGGEVAAGEDAVVLVRGRGYSYQVTSLGPAGQCHVHLDRVAGQRIEGRIRCERVRDDSVPPRLRFIRGQPGMTTDPNFAEFVFDNCEMD